MRETRWINSLIVLPKSSIDVVGNPCVIKPITTFKDVNKIIVYARHPSISSGWQVPIDELKMASYGHHKGIKIRFTRSNSS